jgi:hypothetical protein
MDVLRLASELQVFNHMIERIPIMYKDPSESRAVATVLRILRTMKVEVEEELGRIAPALLQAIKEESPIDVYRFIQSGPSNGNTSSFSI